MTSTTLNIPNTGKGDVETGYRKKRNKAINPTKHSQHQMDKPLLEAAMISKVGRKKGEASILPSSCILPLQHPHRLHPAWLTPL